MTIVNLERFDRALRDCYPLPGERIKQWVVERWAEHAWERSTCPRVEVPDHRDNCGDVCRNTVDGSALWVDLSHDCCGDCNELLDATAGRDDIAAWVAERAKRPKPTEDRDALSDQVMGSDWKPRPDEWQGCVP